MNKMVVVGVTLQDVRRVCLGGEVEKGKEIVQKKREGNNEVGLFATGTNMLGLSLYY
jgi:hypothetical protein